MPTTIPGRVRTPRANHKLLSAREREIALDWKQQSRLPEGGAAEHQAGEIFAEIALTLVELVTAEITLCSGILVFVSQNSPTGEDKNNHF